MKRTVLFLLAATAAFTSSTAVSFAAGNSAQKLDSQLLLVLKQDREQPASNKQPAVQAEAPFREGDSVLVDVQGRVSPDLVKYVTLAGGKLAVSPDPNQIIRAMFPVSQLENLSRRPDVNFISAAQLSIISRLEP